MRDDWKEQFLQRGIDVHTDVLRDEAPAPGSDRSLLRWAADRMTDC